METLLCISQGFFAILCSCKLLKDMHMYITYSLEVYSTCVRPYKHVVEDILHESLHVLFPLQLSLCRMSFPI